MSRLAAGKMIYSYLNVYSNLIVFGLNQLGNSFNIFTPGDVQNTNVACQHSQQTRDVDQCWTKSGPLSATLAQHKTTTGSTPRVCWAADLAVQADTDPMSVLASIH